MLRDPRMDRQPSATGKCLAGRTVQLHSAEGIAAVSREGDQVGRPRVVQADVYVILGPLDHVEHRFHRGPEVQHDPE
jgi:hypothetical protein